MSQLNVTRITGLKNPGLVVLNAPERPVEKKTIIILGVARSGTSMVAGALENLGVYMGEQRNNVTFEDTEIASLLEGSKDLGSKDLDSFDALVAERDARYDIWGWKRPDAIDYVGRFENRIRNPFFIVTFRDILSVATRNVISIGGDFADLLRKAQNDYAKVLNFVFRTPAPCLLVSYEKAILNKGQFVEALIDFVGVTPDAEQRRNAVSFVENDRQIYLDRARVRPFQGGLGQFVNGRIRGWAKARNRDTPVVVEILVDGRLVATESADGFRQDLKDRNIGNGRYGFDIDIAAHVGDGRPHTVQARVQEDGSELGQSPKEIVWTGPGA